jgi:hypothetical protein
MDGYQHIKIMTDIKVENGKDLNSSPTLNLTELKK